MIKDWNILDQIIEKESDKDKKDLLMLIKRFFTDKKFNEYISELIWQITWETNKKKEKEKPHSLSAEYIKNTRTFMNKFHTHDDET